jgi:hypothetical protein
VSAVADDAKACARRAVQDQPRHSAETLFNMIDKLYPMLTEKEMIDVINYGLDQ